MSGRWLPDRSRLQRHVNVAIAYNVWQHYMIIGNLGFLRFMGAELLIEIARFWSSIAQHPSPFRCVNRPSSCPGARDTFSLTSSRDAHR
jgi:trehalose/maltose hydrolase-like predicted phosphorylase